VFKPQLRRFAVSVRLFVAKALCVLYALRHDTSNVKVKLRLSKCDFIQYNFMFC